MHLAINGSDLGRQRGGNESYLWGLLEGLTAIAPDVQAQISLIVASEGARLVQADPRFGNLDLVDVGTYQRLPFLLWQQSAVLHRLQPDWIVSTFFLPLVIPCSAAVLVHDLSFRAHPEYFPSSIASYMRLFTGLAIRRAKVVVALSWFTRREIERFHPSAQEKTVVVYPGIGTEFRVDGDAAADDQALADLDVQRPYLLAVGNIHPRKNLARLLTAWERLRDAGWAVPTMVWAGMGHWDSGELLDRARMEGVRLPGFVGPAHLPALYRQAEALAYPSLYEGFGLPPLEAMACGTPVLASNTTSLPEAAGDAAVLVDPTNTDALADGLARVLFNKELRHVLQQRGLARAAQYQWARTARQLLEALERSWAR